MDHGINSILYGNDEATNRADAIDVGTVRYAKTSQIKTREKPSAGHGSEKPLLGTKAAMLKRFKQLQEKQKGQYMKKQSLLFAGSEKRNVASRENSVGEDQLRGGYSLPQDRSDSGGEDSQAQTLEGHGIKRGETMRDLTTKYNARFNDYVSKKYARDRHRSFLTSNEDCSQSPRGFSFNPPGHQSGPSFPETSHAKAQWMQSPLVSDTLKQLSDKAFKTATNFGKFSLAAESEQTDQKSSELSIFPASNAELAGRGSQIVLESSVADQADSN